VASSASSIEPSATRTSSTDSSTARSKKGVAPLRAGQGYSFVLRRLHSLSGIVPIGAFLIEHFISNSESMNGVQAYNDQVKFLTSLPFVHVLEWVFIFIPLLYHGLYGLWIWYNGDSNVGDYPWTGNWMYTAQRWTGIIAVIFICYHVIDMRFTGVHLMGGGYEHAFSKVWFDFQSPWVVAAYVIGIVAASWHFSYGIWLFAAKWGFTVGDQARRKFGYVCVVVFLIMAGMGIWSIGGFLRTPAAQVPYVEHD
jgi:succinate dehydrogenase / fumarate reductase, cytochrome b subunit